MIIRPPLPGGSVIYCDDIRHEVQNKTSIIGAYGGEMTIYGDVPLKIARLCAYAILRLDPENLPDNLIVNILRLVEGAEPETVSSAQLNLPQQAILDLPEPPSHETDTTTYIQIEVHQKLEVIEFAGQCTLSARMIIGDDEYRLGNLEVKIEPREQLKNLLGAQPDGNH